MVNISSIMNQQKQALIRQNYAEIYAHELAHKNAGGALAGPIVIEKNAQGIPIGGHVSIKMPSLNPKNPQFKNLFFGIAGISALAYGGKAAAEAVKEVQVKKYNAKIELDLQNRLVSTELRNFKAKKEAAIEPLCDEFFKQKANGKSQEELKIIADNILFEIKNGPPFVYS